jgi:CheY-like chemotaxis protein
MKDSLPEDWMIDSGVDERTQRRVARVIRQKLIARGMMVQPSRAAGQVPGRRLEGPARVLIADDYADAAESLALLLKLAGMETRIGMRGDDALLQALQWQPHVCVLDIDMPGCSGRDIGHYLRQQRGTQQPLLIAVTGWTSSEERRLTMEAGFDYYFIKPVEPARLVRVIQQSLRLAYAD